MKPPDDKTDISEPKKKRIYKRTILLVFIVVILPWILISIPGEVIGGGGTTNYNLTHRKHGWPFTHLQSTRRDLCTYVCLNVPPNAPKPTIAATKPLPIDWFNRFFRQPDQASKWLEIDTRLSPSHECYFEQRYWSDLNNWPQWNDDCYSKIRWGGLIANLLLLTIAATIVAIPIQRRIRQDNFFKFSLFTFTAAITLFGLATSLFVRTHNMSQTEFQQIQKLKQLTTDDLINLNNRYHDRFPRVVSQLLNGGQTWWGNVAMFKKLEVAFVDFWIDEPLSLEKAERIVNATRGINAKLEIHTSTYTDRIGKELQLLDQCKVVVLSVHFDEVDWVEEKIGEKERNRLSWEDAVKKADLAIDLDLKLQHLVELELTLTDVLSQKDQLQPFAGLPSLETFRVNDIGAEGIEFILETKDQWPADSTFDCTKDVSPKLLRKLGEAFSL